MKYSMDKEDEYFARIEMERLKKAEEERLRQMEEEERKRLKELHYMRCPKCGMELAEMEYKKIVVDKCFTCGGIWLDSGEMETLLKMEKETQQKFFRIFRK